MLLPHSLVRFLVAAVLVAVLPTDALSESRPLLPAKVATVRLTGDVVTNTWQVGPIVIALPVTWVGQAKSSSVVWLNGPNDTAASFTVLSATASARAAGYSTLTDPRRGPDSFSRTLQWEDCEGAPTPTTQSLSAPVGTKTMYAECTVQVRPGVRAVFAQVALYSPRHLVQIQLLGNREEIKNFLRSLQAVKWKDET